MGGLTAAAHAQVAFLFPGQGSQRKGMGATLFERFPVQTAAADRILGYSISDLCLNDTGGRLKLTQYAQPALFVTNALTWLARREEGASPHFVAGHSLGEYNALFAAGCMDFEAGVRLVQKRGELMGLANGGSMSAVMGLELEALAQLLADSGIEGVDIANHNAPTQIVLSGTKEGLTAIAKVLEGKGSIRCVPLNVSAAFHSRFMKSAANQFRDFMQGFTFREPQVPVIANVTAEPLKGRDIPTLLTQQIYSPVRWLDSMRYLLAHGASEMEELGPGNVLGGLWSAVKKAGPVPRAQPVVQQPVKSAPVPEPVAPPPSSPEKVGKRGRLLPENLGSAEFREDYKLRYAYLSGAMFRGIASTDLVIRMGKAGLMGFFGAGGLKSEDIEKAILTIKRALPGTSNWGMNLLHAPDDVRREEAAVALYLKHDVRFVEAAAFLQMTAPLIHFRFKGAHRDAKGRPQAIRHVMGKISRPEIARAFMQPPPERVLTKLVQEGKLTQAEAEVARELPIAGDICVEADSGGHTDGGITVVLMPAILRVRDELMAQHRYAKRIRVGAAGGIGSPEAAAAAFVLGADFLVTGSINQCTPEAGTSDVVKDILANVDVQDTAYAPAGDMFELGAQVQVVRKGTLFPARGNKLYQLYRQHSSLQELDAQTRQSIEQFYFKRSLDEVWKETQQYFISRGAPDELEKAERNPKHKMALVFKWYFAFSIRSALQGNRDEASNYQIHCGPALGAFNGFVKGTSLENWRNRHVDTLADALMSGTAELLDQRLRMLSFA